MPIALEDCNGCHACCMYAGSPPFRNGAERAALPDALRAELETYYASVADGPSREAQRLPCLWLENGYCKHYEHRPPICRDFVVNGPECQQFVALGVGVP